MVGVELNYVFNNQPERLEQAIITGKELTDEEVKYLEEPYVVPVLLNIESCID